MPARRVITAWINVISLAIHSRASISFHQTYLPIINYNKNTLNSITIVSMPYYDLRFAVSTVFTMFRFNILSLL